jgi:hypothetical protein
VGSFVTGASTGAATGAATGAEAAASDAPQLSQNLASGAAGVPHCVHFTSSTFFTSFALVKAQREHSF